MIINRVWAMPHTETFKIKPISELLYKYVKGEWADPFANNNSPAKYTNDLNTEMKTQYHLDAVEFLKTFKDKQLDGVLLDPPYSLHQVTVSYKGYGDKRVIALTPVYDEIKRVLKDGGICISFGWNTNGLGKVRGMEIKEIIIIPHGGHHNDTLVTVERKLENLL
jgi:hypothetical protein